MNQKQSVKSQTYRRVQQFTDTYMSQHAANSPIGLAVAELSAAIAAFDREAAIQQTRAGEGQERFEAARDALRFKLEAIARTAELIAATSPGFADRFPRPRPNRHSVLRAVADGVLREIDPVAAQFVAKGLPETFVADLHAAVAEHQAASDVLDAGRLARSAVRTGLQQAERRARAAIKAIDLIVRYQFARDPQMQAAWLRAKRQDGLPLPKDVPVSSPTPPPKMASEPAA